jgi:hypothetical protein
MYVRLFNLEETHNLIHKLFGTGRKVLIDLVNQGLTFPEMIIGPRPKLFIKIQLLELHLIDDVDSS